MDSRDVFVPILCLASKRAAVLRQNCHRLMHSSLIRIHFLYSSVSRRIMEMNVTCHVMSCLR